MRAGLVLAVLAMASLAGCLSGEPEVDPNSLLDTTLLFGEREVDVPADMPRAWTDATVVAVVDGGLNPYHFDWAAHQLPQHLDEDPANDLPLDKAPHEWLVGFPDPDSFASYTELELSLTDDPDAATNTLASKDSAQWDKLRKSTSADSAHLAYIPGTKILGLLTFDGNVAIDGNAHGAKAASVSVGNIYGACPECLLVFVDGASEAALEWVLKQPWIDAVTNSYGFSLVMRDRLYSGSDIRLQRDASVRGQSIFFSAGNGQANTFTAPNPTLFSSQEGPDWITTVGAVHPESRASYSGHGKPADVASIGSNYPSQGRGSVTASDTFGGTSSATPTVAGMYAKALYEARSLLPGPSRSQSAGVVAAGEAIACGEARPECELGDGVLTAKELRMRLYHGAVHTPAGMTFTLAGAGNSPQVWELEFLNEGHGTYEGRMDGDAAHQAQVERIVGPMTGQAAALERPAGELEWMRVDSWCRQQIWDLEWPDGYYVDATSTPLPAPNPVWPARTAFLAACPHVSPPF